MKKLSLLSLILIMLSACNSALDTDTAILEKQTTNPTKSIFSGTSNSITVYYKPSDALWLFAPNTISIHFSADNGSWTNAPGLPMTKESTYGPWNGYASYTASASKLQFVVNNGNGSWDNNNSKDYVINETGSFKVENGQIIKIEEEVFGVASIYIDKADPAYFGSGASAVLIGLNVKIENDNGFYKNTTVETYLYGQPYCGLSDLPAGNYIASINQWKNGKKYEGTASFTISSEALDVGVSMRVTAYEDVRIRFSYNTESYLGTLVLAGLPVTLFKDDVEIMIGKIYTGKDGTDVTFRKLLPGNYKAIVGVTYPHNSDISGILVNSTEFRGDISFVVTKNDTPVAPLLMDIESVIAVTPTIEIMEGEYNSFGSLIVAGLVSNDASYIKNRVLTTKSVYWLPAYTNPYVLNLNAAGTYNIRGLVSDTSLVAHLTIVVKSIDFNKEFNSVYLRGTFNNWSSQEMELIADNTWQTVVTFGTSSNERFKFDLYSDWSYNFGDNNSDGIADRNGSDILSSSGTWKIKFNDLNCTYTKERL